MFENISRSRRFRIILGWAVILIMFTAIIFISKKNETGIPVLTILVCFAVIIILILIFDFITKYIKKKAIDEKDFEENAAVKNKFFYMLYALFLSDKGSRRALTHFGVFKAIAVYIALIIFIYFIIIWSLKIFAK